MDFNSNQVEEVVSFKEMLMAIGNEATRRLVSSFLQNLVQRISMNREKIEVMVVAAQQGGITDGKVLGLMTDIFGTTGESGNQWGNQQQPVIESTSADCEPTPGSPHASLPMGLPPGPTPENPNLLQICKSVQGQKLEESREEIVEQLQPLLLPPVLGVLFKKLPLNELKVCRLVCKTWRDESLSSWWTNATLKFEKDAIIGGLQDSTTTLSQYLEYCERECSATPFKKLDISEWDFKVGDPDQGRFFELIGQHLTSVTFFCCSFDGRESVRAIIYKKLPNLQFLGMEICDFAIPDEDDDEDQGPAGEVLTYQEPALGVHGLKSLHVEGCLPDSMLELMSHFHMLDDVSFQFVSNCGLLDVLKAVKIVREQHPNKLPLRNFKPELTTSSLNIQPATELAELTLLRELNLPLRSLHFYYPSVLKGPDFNLEHFGETFRGIVLEHSSTLTEITAMEDMQEILKEFPFGHELSNLKRVTVSPDFFDNLYWLVNSPKLRELAIITAIGDVGEDFDPSDNVISHSPELEVGNWSLPALKSLHVNSTLTAANLRKLIRWMPSVESLEMGLDDEGFAIICAHWKQLTSLTIRGDQLTDKGLTGIWMDSGLPDEETRIPANILQMKRLKSFSARSADLTLTPKSVYEGLLRLHSLVKVDLNHRSLIDAEAIEALERNGVSVRHYRN